MTHMTNLCSKSAGLTIWVAFLASTSASPAMLVQVDPRASQGALMFNQIYPHWHLRCDNPVFASQKIRFDVRVGPDGRLIGYPELVSEGDQPPVDGSTSRRHELEIEANVDSARFAIIRAAPFRVTPDFQGGTFRFVFDPERACGRVR